MKQNSRSWRVELSDEAQELLKKIIRSGELSKEDIRVLRIWTEQMARYGPEFIRSTNDWRDHDLEKEWKGYRASSFSFSGRIIYRVFEEKILVEVVRITPDHDYSRK